ncbi:Uncharacterised protein [uncultured archaeon]|nr:Uncharacterised protein [uncultured archaeon]
MLFIDLFDGAAGLIVRYADREEVLLHGLQIRLPAHPACLVHLPSIEAEEAGQIAGMADVHGIGDAVLARPDGLIDAGAHEARELVILVGRRHEPVHWKAHLESDEAAHEVAEVAAGHGEDRGLALGRCARVGEEVVDCLGQQPADVDGVGRGEAQARKVGIDKCLLYKGLAVVELASDGQRVNVVPQGGHLAALSWCDLLLRE